MSLTLFRFWFKKLIKILSLTNIAISTKGLIAELFVFQIHTTTLHV